MVSRGYDGFDSRGHRADSDASLTAASRDVIQEIPLPRVTGQTPAST